MSRALSSMKARRASLPLVLTPAVTALSGFLTSIAVARWYGAEGRGLYALTITAIMAIAQVTSLGLGEALAIDVARHGGPVHPRRWLLLVWAGCLIVAAAVLAAGTSTVWVVLGAATTTAFLQGTTFALASGRSLHWAAAQLVQPLLLLAVVVCSFVRHVPLDWLLATYALAPAVGAAIVLPAVPSRGGPHGSSSSRRIFTVGIQRQLTVTAMQLVRRVDVLSLGAVAALTVIGPYAIALSLIDLSLVLPWVLSGAVLRDELAGANIGKGRVALRMATFVLPFLLGTVALGWWLIPLIWGEDFRIGYWYVLAMAPGALALGAARGLLSWRMGRNEQAMVAKRFLIALLPAAALIFVSARMGGPFGAAGASSLVFFSLFLCAWIEKLPGRRAGAPEATAREETP